MSATTILYHTIGNYNLTIMLTNIIFIETLIQKSAEIKENLNLCTYIILLGYNYGYISKRPVQA